VFSSAATARAECELRTVKHGVFTEAAPGTGRLTNDFFVTPEWGARFGRLVSEKPKEEGFERTLIVARRGRGE